jgi:hypothetical protein
VGGKEERRRRRQQERDEDVAQARVDIRFVRARGFEIELGTAGGLAREHLSIGGVEHGETDKGAFVAQRHERMELNDRIERLLELEKTESGRQILHDALKSEGETNV